MKKLILSLLVASAMITSCSKSDDEPQNPTSSNVTAKAEYDEFFDNTLYPAFIYEFSNVKNDEGNLEHSYFDLTINSDVEFSAKIRVRNDKFINETILRKSITKGENVISIAPLWKLDDFVNFKTAGQTTFQFEVIDDKTNKVVANDNLRLQYRSINECAFAFNGGETNYYPMFAAFVNEDNRLIDTYLKVLSIEARKKDPNFSWCGYQEGFDAFAAQIITVVNDLYERGFSYSSITTTSNSSQKVWSQYVRLFEESFYLQSANCVDGSVLLASIFEKIGLRCYLVITPGHMYLAIHSNNSDWNFEDYSSLNELYFIETTAISTGDTKQIYVDKVNSIIAEPKTQIIDIRKARASGIKPIQ